MRVLHLLAMAFFVGGQLVLVAAVLPTLRGEETRPLLRGIARRFGYGSIVALAVLVATGSVMAGRLGRWEDGTLQLKLGLVALVVAVVVWHVMRPARHVLEAVVLVLSLAIVALGVSIAH
jgi:putative copper export protein